MKHTPKFGVIAVFLLAMTAPSNSMAQSWWEGFANAPQAGSFQQWLTQHPNAAGPLQNDPYQIYDPSWRAQHPEFQEYINRNPGWWSGMRANGAQYYDERFSEFLRNHPGVARDLRQNPDLIYDPRYRAQHPELNTFLAGHKKIWRSIKYQNYATSNPGGWGAYDRNREYHDSDWWRDHGDWDEHHEWHDRDWWHEHRADWVREHHPDWYNKYEEHREKHEEHREWKEQEKAEREAAKEAKHQGKHGHGHGDHDND